jgi:hypothetical protein
MADDKPIIPITDEQAKAIQETAKLGQDTIGLVKDFGGYARQVFGTAPENLVALFGGDWLERRRLKSIAETMRLARDLLRERGVDDPEPINLAVGLPLLKAAADESGRELQEVWARLLAAAMDPKRARTVRREFIETIQRFAPLDAVIMQRLYKEAPGAPTHQSIADWTEQFGVSQWEMTVALENLQNLRCIHGFQVFATGSNSGKLHAAVISGYGRELMRACAD